MVNTKGLNSHLDQFIIISAKDFGVVEYSVIIYGRT